MTEDTQIKIMFQPTNQIPAGMMSHTATGVRRNGGLISSHHENDKSKNKAISGVHPKLPTKRQNKKPNFGERREKQCSKHFKKSQPIYDNKQIGLQSLLNFQYSSVQGKSTGYQGTARKRTSTFNKEVFLQANCHFVVDGDENYSINEVDPDVLVDWDKIQLVYFPTHDVPECPICLYPPSAAKMTRCGHVYCWNCILHYLDLSDKDWRKCPICHESVSEKDLKSVVCCVRKKFAKQDTINMVLMKRSKDSVFATPKPLWDSKNTHFPAWTAASPLNTKLMLASKKSLQENILLREKKELEIQLNLTDETSEECFIQAALDRIQIQLESIAPVLATTYEQNDEVNSRADEVLANVLKDAAISGSQEAFSDDDTDVDSFDLTPSIPSSKLTEHIADKVKQSSSVEKQLSKECGSYHFYQAEDGQNIFIHSLNARCLIEEYGSLGETPHKITGQIIDFESFTMNKELRKRFRYLSHLPIACEFYICELLLRPPVLSKHTVYNFMPEFKKRKASRLRKLNEQRKFDQKASAARNKQEGYRVDVDDEFDINLDLSDMIDFPCSFSSPDSGNGAEKEPLANDSFQVRGPSFAAMLKTDNCSSKQKFSKGDIKNESVKDDIFKDMKYDCEENDEEIIQAPTFKEMFDTAMLNASVEQKQIAGKKKKKKGLLLFSTGAQRKY